eukprot:5448684-Pyramimonas_sp.AAC.1
MGLEGYLSRIPLGPNHGAMRAPWQRGKLMQMPFNPPLPQRPRVAVRARWGPRAPSSAKGTPIHSSPTPSSPRSWM